MAYTMLRSPTRVWSWLNEVGKFRTMFFQSAWSLQCYIAWVHINSRFSWACGSSDLWMTRSCGEKSSNLECSFSYPKGRKFLVKWEWDNILWTRYDIKLIKFLYAIYKTIDKNKKNNHSFWVLLFSTLFCFIVWSYILWARKQFYQ